MLYIFLFGLIFDNIFMFNHVDICLINNEAEQMLADWGISELLTTFFEKYVGKFAVNQKNVQHRHNSTH